MVEDDQALLRAMVRGRIQGVGFRAFVVSKASALALTGFARNTSDGAGVEVVAEGPRPALEALLLALRQGPSMSRVERVDVSWGAVTNGYEGFGVR